MVKLISIFTFKKYLKIIGNNQCNSFDGNDDVTINQFSVVSGLKDYVILKNCILYGYKYLLFFLWRLDI